MEDIWTVPLPTPFGVGDVNAYIIDDDPFTILDVGPDWGRTLVALSDALATRGKRICDIGRIVLTHQHPDHAGLAKILVDRSGAEVCALDEMAPWLAAHDERIDAEADFVSDLLRRHGVPEPLAEGMRTVNAERRCWGEAVTVNRILKDGDLLPFANRAWRVHHRPGHSPSDTVFHDEQRGTLFSGDHLVKHISSNALVTPALSGDVDEATLELRSLQRYADSLRATRELEPQLVYAGHGEVIEDPSGLILRRLGEHQKRASKIEAILQGCRLTAFEIAQRMWGATALAQPYLVVSEVLGHLGLLIDSGRATSTSADIVTLFEKV